MLIANVSDNIRSYGVVGCQYTRATLFFLSSSQFDIIHGTHDKFSRVMKQISRIFIDEDGYLNKCGVRIKISTWRK